MGDDHVRALAARAERRELAEGELIMVQGEPAEAFFVLERGELRVSFAARGAEDEEGEEDAAARRDGGGGGVEVAYATSEAGHPLGWAAAVDPYRYRATASALRPSAVLRLERRTVEAYAAEHPPFALELARRALWLAGSRLRAVRLRLVRSRFATQEEAIRSLLVEHAGELAVTSRLHRIPHLLASRVTLDDAVQTIDALLRDGDPAERELAALITQQLHEVRGELELFRRLQAIYELVASAPADRPAAEIRLASLLKFQSLFAETRHRIEGAERLPDGGGHVVVMNHLVNHPDNLLPNDFILTLDTHFVASMILLPRYGEAPVRVVRRSARRERGHQRFFDRLGYLTVEPGMARDGFLEAAAAELAAGRNIVICPEGTSVTTEESPVAFRAGAFRLAARVRPEPLVIPVAVANFDKKLTHTRTAAIVGEPVRLSEHLVGEEDEHLHAYVNGVFQPRIAAMVRDAVRLAG